MKRAHYDRERAMEGSVERKTQTKLGNFRQQLNLIANCGSANVYASVKKKNA